MSNRPILFLVKMNGTPVLSELYVKAFFLFPSNILRYHERLCNC